MTEVCERVTLSTPGDMSLVDEDTNTAHSSSSHSHSHSEPFFPEAADIGESFRQVNSYLVSIRDEKVWRVFKLCDAEFSYQQARSNYLPCFSPMIGLFELEVHILRWFMCPTDAFMSQLVACAEQTLEQSHQVIRSIKQLPSQDFNQHQKEYSLLLVESSLIVAEITMIQALIEFKRKNYMTAAHAMVKGHNKYKEVMKLIQAQQSRTDKKYRTEYIINLCEVRKKMDLEADEKLLASLTCLIDEKAREIRAMKCDRRAMVPETMIEATRDLLQLKQLYKDLTGKWRSSDGHADAGEQTSFGNSNSNSNNSHKDPIAELHRSSVEAASGRPDSSKSSSQYSTPQKAQRSSSHSPQSDSGVDGNDENHAANIFPSPKGVDKKRAGFAAHFESQSAKSNTHFKKAQELKSPRRLGVPVVNVFIPRLGDIAKYFDIDPIPDPKVRERHTTAGHKKKATFATNLQAAFEDKERNHPVENGDELLEELDFKSLWDLNTDIYHRHIVQSKSRLSFAEALFNIGLSLIPKQISWMLAIVSINSNPVKAVSTLYSLHNFDQCQWGSIATLILLNLPLSYLQKLFDGQEDQSHAILQDTSITRIEQFHPLIEAQSLLKSWTAKNPLWLCTAARSCTDNICINLHTRLDFYRRALQSEKDAFPSTPSSASEQFNRYYHIHDIMAKHFLSIGHWSKALAACRQIALPSFTSQLTLEAYALLRASSAALIVHEDFSYQTKYLQLKFNERFIRNGTVSNLGGTIVVAEGPNGNGIGSDISASILAINRKYNIETLLSLSSYHNMTSYDFSLYSRLLTFDHYHTVLRKSSRHHRSEAEIVLREYLGSWCWLQPIEMTYIMSRNEDHVNEAAHSQMLQLCDKGALLFAEKYLQSHMQRDEQTEERFLQLKELISGIIIDDLAIKDSLTMKKALSPTCKLKLCYEQNILTGAKSLRINAEDPQGEHNTAILLNTLINKSNAEISSNFKQLIHKTNNSFLNSLMAPSPPSASNPSSPLLLTETEMKAMRLLKKVQEKHDKIGTLLTQSSNTILTQQISDSYAVYDTADSDKVVGEVLVLWLLCRGMILIEMHCIWEAVMMFKLIETLKDSAPRAKFASFIAYYQLAELVLHYDLCEHPLVVGSEYIRRSSVYMQRALDSNLLSYLSEYNQQIQELSSKLQDTV